MQDGETKAADNDILKTHPMGSVWYLEGLESSALFNGEKAIVCGHVRFQGYPPRVQVELPNVLRSKGRAKAKPKKIQVKPINLCCGLFMSDEINCSLSKSNNYSILSTNNMREGFSHSK